MKRTDYLAREPGNWIEEFSPAWIGQGYGYKKSVHNAQEWDVLDPDEIVYVAEYGYDGKVPEPDALWTKQDFLDIAGERAYEEACEQICNMPGSSAMSGKKLGDIAKEQGIRMIALIASARLADDATRAAARAILAHSAK